MLQKSTSPAGHSPKWPKGGGKSVILSIDTLDLTTVHSFHVFAILFTSWQDGQHNRTRLSENSLGRWFWQADIYAVGKRTSYQKIPLFPPTKYIFVLVSTRKVTLHQAIWLADIYMSCLYIFLSNWPAEKCATVDNGHVYPQHDERAEWPNKVLNLWKG